MQMQFERPTLADCDRGVGRWSAPSGVQSPPAPFWLGSFVKQLSDHQLETIVQSVPQLVHGTPLGLMLNVGIPYGPRPPPLELSEVTKRLQQFPFFERSPILLRFAAERLRTPLEQPEHLERFPLMKWLVESYQMSTQHRHDEKSQHVQQHQRQQQQPQQQRSSSRSSKSVTVMMVMMMIAFIIIISSNSSCPS